jgi:hypothetical protein
MQALKGCSRQEKATMFFFLFFFLFAQPCPKHGNLPLNRPFARIRTFLHKIKHLFAFKSSQTTTEFEKTGR